MRTYFADIEGMVDRSSFLYRIEANTDQEAITHFKRVFGDRLEMIVIQGRDKRILVYEKPGLFGSTEEIPSLDYRSLLKQYIKHVIDMEGVSFLEEQYDKTGHISEREWEELLTLYRDVDEGDKR